MQLPFKMNKTNRLKILKRAREIISDPKDWGTRKLRKRVGSRTQYCLLGACEKAVYDLGLAEPDKHAFSERSALGGPLGLGYQLSDPLSLLKYSRKRHGAAPEFVNDVLGHEKTLALLDGYIAEVTETPASKLRA